MNRRLSIVFALIGICCVTLALYYYESIKLFEDIPVIIEPKPRNETNIDDVLILIFSGKLRN